MIHAHYKFLLALLCTAVALAGCGNQLDIDSTSATYNTTKKYCIYVGKHSGAMRNFRPPCDTRPAVITLCGDACATLADCPVGHTNVITMQGGVDCVFDYTATGCGTCTGFKILSGNP